MTSRNIEDKNFGWSIDRFWELKAQIQAGNASSFQAELKPYLKESAIYTMNLAKKWLKKEYLDVNERHLVQDALHDAFARFEQRMSVRTDENRDVGIANTQYVVDNNSIKGVEYGNLKDWLVGNAFSRFQVLYEKEQKETAHLVPIDGTQINPINEEREEDLMVYLIAKVLDKMPDDAKYFYRRTLKMLYWQGYSIEEIADKINVGYENLRKELSAKIRPLFKTELKQLATQFNMDLTKNRVPLH
jgi:Putative ATPase subunit of terminase (gpP-like)